LQQQLVWLLALVLALQACCQPMVVRVGQVEPAAIGAWPP
jgi:hypothetical protein